MPFSKLELAFILPRGGIFSATGDDMSKDATLKSSKEAKGAGPRGSGRLPLLLGLVLARAGLPVDDDVRQSILWHL